MPCFQTPSPGTTLSGVDRDTGDAIDEHHGFATVTAPAGVPVDPDDDTTLPTWAADLLDAIADDDAIADAIADATTSDEVRTHTAHAAARAARNARDRRAAARRARRTTTAATA